LALKGVGRMSDLIEAMGLRALLISGIREHLQKSA
jgi:hypothetical protein